jgi:hypothetical protein
MNMVKLILKLIPAVLVAAIALSSAHRSVASAALGVTPVRIENESAIIVWNQAAQTEHFIRTVNFDTDSSDLGYIVPTPSIPTLSAVDDGAVPALREAVQPTLTGNDVFIAPTSFLVTLIRIYKSETQPVASSLLPPTIGQSDVDEEKDTFVDGVQATTISASDVLSLKKWLKQNGYEWSSGIGDWLQPYITKHWYLTVYKYVKPAATADNLVSKTVDLTFKTSLPFYPYSEPEDMRLMGGYVTDRLLRVYVVSSSRVNAALEPNPQGKEFPGTVISAAPLPDDKRDAIASLLKLRSADMPNGAWLTAFDDNSSPRPGYTDLDFSPSADQSQIIVKPVDHRTKHPIYISLDLVAFVLFFMMVIKLRRLQRAGKLDKNGNLIRLGSVLGFLIAYVGLAWVSFLIEGP